MYVVTMYDNLDAAANHLSEMYAFDSSAINADLPVVEILKKLRRKSQGR
jgi:hypothetical protein